MDNREVSKKNLIFECVIGSRAYGTSVPSSDTDIRGVFIGEQRNILTPFFPVDQVEGPGDRVIFELSKYVKFLSEQNPNILEIIWAPEDCIQHEDPVWDILKRNRDNLLSSKLQNTFCGYAFSQLKRIKGHNKWINNPQSEQPPVPADYLQIAHNFTEDRRLNKGKPPKEGFIVVSSGSDLYLLYHMEGENWAAPDGNIKYRSREEMPKSLKSTYPALIARFDRQSYKNDKRSYDDYWQWVRNRNASRSALEKEYGYDVKHAMHLIRLLRMGYEGLTEGVIRVRRPDAEELLEIRNGSLKYDEVLSMAEELEERVNEAAKTTHLPKSINPKDTSDIVMSMYEAWWDQAHSHGPVQRPDQAPIMPSGRVVAIDLEGTGYRRNGEKTVCEIAAVEYEHGVKTGRTFHSYIDPQSEINPHAKKLHGLTTEFLTGKPLFEEVLPEFVEFLGQAAILAHDARNDAQMLNHDLAICDFDPIPRSRFGCTQRIARKLFPGKDMSLDKLCDVLGIDRGVRDTRGHQAFLDAQLAGDAWVKMSRMPGFDQIGGVQPKRYRERPPRDHEDESSPTPSM